LEKEIIFTGFRSDIDKVMRSLDILVICSKDPDPCPLVSLEAASRGLAIISTDLGGTKEIFKENEEAFFYKSGDFKELANKILHFYEYRQLMHAMAEAARKKVIKEHNLDGYLERITNTVEKTIHGD
jgi:glycosyltransferase involved in cell wall biosynthesis